MKNQLSAQEVLAQMKRTQKDKSFSDKLSTFIAQLIVVLLKLALWGVGICGLWNSVVPDIFGLPTITFSQSVKLFLLITLLFDVSSHTSKPEDD